MARRLHPFDAMRSDPTPPDPARPATAGPAAARDARLRADVVRVVREAAAAYAAVAPRVATPRLRRLFAARARAHSALAACLAASPGAPAAESRDPRSRGARLRRFYLDLLARVAPDAERAYVAQLEEVEDGVLQAFEDALDEARSRALRAELAARLPAVRAGHDRMRTLKQGH